MCTPNPLCTPAHCKHRNIAKLTFGEWPRDTKKWNTCIHLKPIVDLDYHSLHMSCSSDPHACWALEESFWLRPDPCRRRRCSKDWAWEGLPSLGGHFRRTLEVINPVTITIQWTCSRPHAQWFKFYKKPLLLFFTDHDAVGTCLNVFFFEWH